MRYFRFAIGGPEVHIYPLVCWHIGAKQSSYKLIEEVIRQVKQDPLARWIYMGDGGEVCIKNSKGNIYEQLLSPGDQLRVVAELLAPIREKGLFGIRGNHGNRIDRETGLGWDEALCARVGVPYLGVSALGQLVLSHHGSHKPVSLFCHHGSAGAVTPAGKMGAGHKPEGFIQADVLLTAHTHACGACWPFKQYAAIDNKNRRIVWRTQRAYVCGSAYDSRSGYAEEKMYTPILPEHLVVEARLIRKHSHRVLHDPMELEVTHRTIDGFGEQFATREDSDKWTGKMRSPLEELRELGNLGFSSESKTSSGRRSRRR